VERLRTEDIGFILLSISLFALAILNLTTGSLSSLFHSPPGSSSAFAVISSILVLFYSIVWGFIRIGGQFEGKKLGMKTVLNIMFQKSASLIGLRKPSVKGLAYIILSMVFGMMANFLILVILSLMGYGVLYRVASPPIDGLLQNLVVPPIFEELIFRGIYLGVFLKLFGKSYWYSSAALMMSAFTFGWIHPAQPIVKTVGSFLLGSIYLFGWKKNLIASSMTHFGMNLVGSFFVLVS
jgi:membrane protease YdiL (CAAX protease family)